MDGSSQVSFFVSSS